MGAYILIYHIPCSTVNCENARRLLKNKIVIYSCTYRVRICTLLKVYTYMVQANPTYEPYNDSALPRVQSLICCPQDGTKGGGSNREDGQRL